MTAQSDEMAQARYWRRNLPSGTTAPGGGEMTECTTSQAFGPFTAGAYVLISCDGAIHVNAGGDGGGDAATTSHPKIEAAGVHDFTMPEGCTHVNIIAETAGTEATAWEG